MHPSRLLVSVCILVLLLAFPAAAHVPVLPGDHNSLATAMRIGNPAVSYAIYGALHEAGEADYYTVAVRKGDPLDFMVFTPLQGSYTPWLVIAGPGLDAQGIVPPGVEVPAEAVGVVIPGTRPATAEYEPFSPMALYRTARYAGEAPADGTYMIAVYTPGDGGPYSLASGKLESFTALEWILVPVDLIGVRLWQGQSLLVIFGPYLAVMILGTGLVFRESGRRRMSPAVWPGLVAGLLFLGTGIAVILETAIALQSATSGPSLLVTLAFALIALGAGAAAVILAVRVPDVIPMRFRILMGVIALTGLVAWAGLIAGPVLALVAALVPSRNR